MSSRSTTVLAFVLMLPLCTASAQRPAVDSIAAAEMARFQIPGMAIAVLRQGVVVIKAAYGVADLERHVPVTAATPFQLASTMKPMTASLVMRLVQEGKLSLSDTLGAWLTTVPEAWRAVTIAQMLNHTSGLPDVAVSPGRADLVAETWEGALGVLRQRPLAFPAGTRWSYDQTNYVLLGKIVERIVGAPFETALIERLLRPAGVRDAVFSPGAGGVPAALNYQPAADGTPEIRKLSFPDYVHTAGGLFMSLDAMIAFDHAIDTGALLAPRSLERSWVATTLADGTVFRLDRRTTGYGLGWVVNDRAHHRSVGHSGGNCTAFARFLDDHVTIIVLHNGNRNPDAIVEAIAQVVIPALAPARD